MARGDLRKVPHAFRSNYDRFSIRMVFAAYLLEMHICCCPGAGHLYPIFKPPHEAFAAFPNQNDKYPTNARKGGEGGGGGGKWACLEFS